MIICGSVQIIENAYGRVVARDVLSREKNLGGSTQVLIEVRPNIFSEVKTGFNIRKYELGIVHEWKPTTEDQRHWVHPVKTKADGK